MARKVPSTSKNLNRRSSSMDDSMGSNESFDTTEQQSSGNRSRRGSSSVRQEREFSDILKEFVASPAFRYAAGGIATALLSRLANNMSGKYPEISNFIRDNIDSMESRLTGGGESTQH